MWGDNDWVWLGKEIGLSCLYSLLTKRVSESDEADLIGISNEKDAPRRRATKTMIFSFITRLLNLCLPVLAEGKLLYSDLATCSMHFPVRTGPVLLILVNERLKRRVSGK